MCSCSSSVTVSVIHYIVSQEKFKNFLTSNRLSLLFCSWLTSFFPAKTEKLGNIPLGKQTLFSSPWLSFTIRTLAIKLFLEWGIKFKETVCLQSLNNISFLPSTTSSPESHKKNEMLQLHKWNNVYIYHTIVFFFKYLLNYIRD